MRHDGRITQLLKELFRRVVPRGTVRRIYRQMVLDYIGGLSPEYDPSRKTILAINHYYDQDLRALQNANTRFNFVVVDFEVLFKIGRLYFSKPVREMMAPYDEEPAEIREGYRDECRVMFHDLRRRFQPDVILTPSDSFAFIREFIAVGHENNIGTVVYDKEGTLSPYGFRAVADWKKRFAPHISDNVLVWSERQREFYESIGVAHEDIAIVGQARSDLFFTEHKKDIDSYFPKEQPLIGIFTYHDTAYIPRELVSEGVSWRQQKMDTLDDMLAAAKEHPEFNFLVKAHPQQLDIKDLQKRYELENLKVIGGAAIANELIQRSELIVAFQTTSVTEAMFMNKRVIYTAWDANCATLQHELVPFHAARGIIIAESRRQFKEVCDRFFAGDVSDFEFSPEEIAARDEFVNAHLYRPDGHVAERVLDELDRFLTRESQ